MQVVPLILKDLKGLLDASPGCVAFFFVKQDHVFMGFAFSYLGFLVVSLVPQLRWDFTKNGGIIFSGDKYVLLNLYILLKSINQSYVAVDKDTLNNCDFHVR